MAYMRGLAILTALALLAGCIKNDPEPISVGDHPFDSLVPEVPDFDFTTVVDPDHLHHLPGLHAVGHGLDLVGHAAVQSALPPTVRGSITQVDVNGDYAVVSGMEGGLGFAIVDLTDRSAPETISWFPSSADGWTARFSKDGDYVFYGCQRLETYNIHALLGSTCDDPSSILSGPDHPSGIIVVDVTDKAKPVFVDFMPTRGSHNLIVAEIAGVDYVFTDGVDILKFDRETQKLEHLALVPGRHDASVQQHPITGDWLMVTGTNQLSIYNVNDPADPVQLYEGTSDDPWVGWHEQTIVPGIVDGRVVMALAGESLVGTELAMAMDTIFIVDITDPETPELRGTWQPPFDATVPWISYLFSAHEIAATPTGQLAIAWYHAGVWVIDVSTPERQAEPVVLAAYQPNKEINVTPATFAQTPLPYVPFVWGAGWMADGHLVVPDMHTGVYVMAPDWGLHPAIDGGN